MLLSKLSLEVFEGKTALVTGGAGFIGSHIVERLLSLKCNVIALDDMSAGKYNNIDIFKDNSNYSFINKSITEKNGWDFLSNVDYIFDNAASKKNICLENPLRDLEVNAGGVLNLLQQSLKYNIKKFVHASTGSVYGEPKIFPTDESHILAPVSYYGVSKLAGEKYVDTFNKLHGLNTTNLRYFHVYGPRQESNEFGGVCSIFTRNIINNEPLIVHGNGKQMRSFTYVNDLVDANLSACLSECAIGETYNVASSIQVSILDLAKKLIEINGLDDSMIKFGERLIGDIDYFDVSNKKCINELKVGFNTDFWGSFDTVFADIKNSVI